ncbi:hypothetical protein M427DRAFT_415580 [Gonapodya prolifera JEL478]|uniref:RRM domain-containing protein n=1 Tax=Gonapodya prolifera (strain JEL478) TaxID=1344416 RepID=A0A139A5G7_GONPJ|nr:hypothetical protein M427DRAFT_415580 [Gonapodya prolifera JEL478]|eukprot:KXS11879.1 hypothetical protein M427DRAFT_415580 [Gonapodya prolifera JEL478]
MPATNSASRVRAKTKKSVFTVTDIDDGVHSVAAAVKSSVAVEKDVDTAHETTAVPHKPPAEKSTVAQSQKTEKNRAAHPAPQQTESAVTSTVDMDLDAAVEGADSHNSPAEKSPVAAQTQKKKKQRATHPAPHQKAQPHAQPTPPPSLSQQQPTPTDAHQPAKPQVPLDRMPGSDFIVLPVHLPQPTVPVLVKKRDSTDPAAAAPMDLSNVVHYIYFKPHAVSGVPNSARAYLPHDRTLFLTNVPFDASQSHIQRLFRRCGKVVRVVWPEDVPWWNLAEEKAEKEMEESVDAEEEDEDEDMDSDNHDADADGTSTSTSRKRKSHTSSSSSPSPSTSKRARTSPPSSSPFAHLDRLPLLPFTDPLSAYPHWRAHRTGGSAHVVFDHPEAVERAVAMGKRRRVWAEEEEEEGQGGGAEGEGEEDGDDGEKEDGEEESMHPHEVGVLARAKKMAAVGKKPRGVERYLLLHHLRRPHPRALFPILARTLAQHDRAAALLRDRGRQPKVDADGFTVVGPGEGFKKGEVVSRAPGKKGGRSAGGGGEEGKEKKKAKGDASLVDFYRFQFKDKRMDALAELRRKFEEDKKKVDVMKAGRVFRPT